MIFPWRHCWHVKTTLGTLFAIEAKHTIKGLNQYNCCRAKCLVTVVKMFQTWLWKPLTFSGLKTLKRKTDARSSIDRRLVAVVSALFDCAIFAWRQTSKMLKILCWAKTITQSTSLCYHSRRTAWSDIVTFCLYWVFCCRFCFWL